MLCMLSEAKELPLLARAVRSPNRVVAHGGMGEKRACLQRASTERASYGKGPFRASKIHQLALPVLGSPASHFQLGREENLLLLPVDRMTVG